MKKILTIQQMNLIFLFLLENYTTQIKIWPKLFHREAKAPTNFKWNKLGITDNL